MKAFDSSDRTLALSLFDCIRGSRPIMRASYGSDESRALAVIADAARSGGLTTEIDRAGNLVMLVGESWPDNASVTGSHLDSVPNGGNYDGLAGVIAALLVLRRARENGVTKPLVGLGLRGEESAWFGIPYIGAKALFGKLTPSDLQRKAPHATSLEYAMASCGANVERVAAQERLLPSVREFWELHIEQGPVLVDSSCPVGVVTAIRGNVRAPNAKIFGQAGHSGTTPHHLRQDAVLRFAKLISACEMYRETLDVAGQDIVMTCGMVGTVPEKHAMTTIADEVRFSLDIRSVDPRVCSTMMEFAQKYAGSTADWGDVIVTPGVSVPGTMIHRLKTAMSSLGIAWNQWRELPSGAGHDAAVFAQAGVPSGMIFVRNQHGSHNPHEDMDIGDFMLGVEVLYETMVNQ